MTKLYVVQNSDGSYFNLEGEGVQAVRAWYNTMALAYTDKSVADVVAENAGGKAVELETAELEPVTEEEARFVNQLVESPYPASDIADALYDELHIMRALINGYAIVQNASRVPVPSVSDVYYAKDSKNGGLTLIFGDPEGNMDTIFTEAELKEYGLDAFEREAV